MIDKRLSEKTVVISGGTKGVGRDLAIACAEHGANVVIGGRDSQAAKAVVDTIAEKGQKGLFVYTDLRQPENCDRLFTEAEKKFGRINGFVNYAGITLVASLLESDGALFDDVMTVNFKAAFFCVKYAVSSMIKSGGGSIILVNSCHAWRGEKDRVVYACSKGALMTLCEHIAFHYSSDGIRCNMITMGWSATEGELALRQKQGMSQKKLEAIASEAIPMGRMQTSEDYIPGMIYLLSDASSMATGGNIRISGGLYL